MKHTRKQKIFYQYSFVKITFFLFLTILVLGLPILIITSQKDANNQGYAAGTDLYVSPTGSDTNNGSQTSPFATIQKAADSASAGTTVHVLPGTYNEFVTVSKSGTATSPITFISDTKWGAKIVATGGLKDVPFRSDGDYIHIIGFDITSSTSADGFDVTGSYNLVQGNHVHDLTGMQCTGSPGGGGMGDDPPGSNNIFDGNVINNIGSYPTKCDFVHGIYVDDAGDVIENNISYNNAGNGIYVNHETGPLTFINNLSFANAEYGFGVNGTQAVSGFVVANNISMGNGIAGFKTWAIITGAQYINNISFNNPTDFIQDGAGTDTGTIKSDPQFVNYQANGSGDYHLKATSPAIDAGVSTNAPATDYDGHPRPQGTGIDIGPFEYGGNVTTTTATVTMTPQSNNITGIPTTVSVTPTLIPQPTLFCMGSCPTTASSPAQTQANTAVSGIPNIGTVTGTGGFSMSSIMAMIQNLMGSMLGGMGFGSTGTANNVVNMNNISNGNVNIQNTGGTTSTGSGISGIGNMMSGLGNLLGL